MNLKDKYVFITALNISLKTKAENWLLITVNRVLLLKMMSYLSV